MWVGPGSSSAEDVWVSREVFNGALEMLCVYAILARQNQSYQFVPRAFPEILRRAHDIQRLILDEKNKLKKTIRARFQNHASGG
jgi:hypothetical protein